MLPPGWSKQVFTFRASSTGTTQLQFTCGASGAPLWLDRVYLFQGNANVFRRDFERGIVVANGTPSSRTIELGGTFRRISGTGQDPINDGATVTRVTLQPYDGLFLIPNIP